jgi:hypothetical protein
VHRAVFERDERTVTLTVADVGTVLAAALLRFRPSLAREVRDAAPVEVVRRRSSSLGATLAQYADAVRVFSILLPLAAIALAAGALWVAPERRRTVTELGVAAAGAGVVVVVALGVAKTAALRQVDGPEARAAAGAVWDAFLGDLRTAAWILAACGAVVAAAATSILRPVNAGETLRQAAERLVAEPAGPTLRALRAVTLVAAGIFVIVARDAVVSLAVTLLGVTLVYTGVNALLRLIYRPAVAQEAEAEVEDDARAVAQGRRGRRIAAALTAGAVIVVTVAAFLSTGGASTAAPRTDACNGHVELCDRPLDEVAMVATHNAMAVPLPGWFASEQERPIKGQLEDGVRGLLVDTHYADRLPNGRLRTYFGSPEDERRQAAQDGLGADAVDAALRIRDRLGFAGQGTRGMYLCHTFCEVGATPLGPVLEDLRDFLVTHPEEVVVVINQDYVTPADLVGAVNDAGLGSFVSDAGADGDWPTLREMIDSGRRLVFLAENHAGAAPWYRLVYRTLTEETPFHFGRVALLNDSANVPASCRPNRGPKGAPLFLVNHWISTDPVPRPSDASKVNAYGPLLRRVQECARIRDHVANLVAINFYKRGDAFRVVDTMNRVGGQ